MEIDELSEEARQIVETLQGPDAVSMPFEDMLALEQRYTNVVRKLNVLLQTREVILGAPVMEPDYDLEALYAEQDDLLVQRSKATSYTDIGTFDYWPVIGKKHQVNSNFGSRWDPITQASYSYHKGIDLYAPMSTPIGAWFTGFVYSTGYSTTSGNYIWLDHGDGVRSYYCHLSEIKVTKGQQVNQGDVIALSGNTGTRTTGPHLHLGLYLDGTAVDPAVVLPG